MPIVPGNGASGSVARGVDERGVGRALPASGASRTGFASVNDESFGTAASGGGGDDCDDERPAFHGHLGPHFPARRRRPSAKSAPSPRSAAVPESGSRPVLPWSDAQVTRPLAMPSHSLPWQLPLASPSASTRSS